MRQLGKIKRTLSVDARWNPWASFVAPLVIVAAVTAILWLVADEFGLDGGIWSVVNAANDNFGALGYAVIAIFVTSWLISLVVYRVMGYDKLNALGPSERLP